MKVTNIDLANKTTYKSVSGRLRKVEQIEKCIKQVDSLSSLLFIVVWIVCNVM